MLYNPFILSGLLIFLLLLVSAFFSAAETALTAVSRPRIYRLVMNGNKAAQTVSKLRRHKESLIGAVLLGNTAVNVAASALATSFALTMFGSQGEMVAIVTVSMTLLLVIFAEILPKTYAIQNAEAVSLKLAPAVNLIVVLLTPVTWSVQHFIRALFALCGVDIVKATPMGSVTDLLRGTIELHHREGRMVKQERDMLGSILDLSDIEVRHIMIHRKQVETVNADLAAEVLVAQAVSTMHSRLPLWRGNPDNIVGVLHVKNLIKLIGERRDSMDTAAILAASSKPWFIPETTSLHDQLLAFRNQRQHIAFVVDEYGAWQGIVTLEDIIEEIVGNIDDEHDEIASLIQKAGPDAYIVSGSLPLRDLNRQLDWTLPDEDASTAAGLLIHEAQRIPAAGEHFDLHGFRFTVLGRDAVQVTRLRIEKLPDTVLPEDMEL